MSTGLADALGRRLADRLRDRVMAACLAPGGIGHLEDPATLALVSGAAEGGTTKVTAREALISAVAVGTIRTTSPSPRAPRPSRWWTVSKGRSRRPAAAAR